MNRDLTSDGNKMIDEGAPVAPLEPPVGVLEPYEVFR